ncbi:SseB family protein [Streptomyces venezuelae]|uniref:SseB family protein n=1 Tax=Streptomyces venezuelae TaxID=54571 RepID=UPI00278BF6B0|nr:SseB family protein [Streptomyces venezuelae]
MTDTGDGPRDEALEPQHLSRLAQLTHTREPNRDLPNRPDPVDEGAVARRRFARLLGEFRRTAVLVPYDDHGSLWTADFNGVRWICAFSDEEALARFALARGDAAREWTYQRLLGARLLDVMVPLLPGPGGVALDAGSADGTLFPPVAGIVPDEVAVDPGTPADLGGTAALGGTADLGGTGTR